MEEHKSIRTSRELAQEAGLTVSYIRRLLRNGIIKGEKPGGRDWLISDDEAKRWLEEKRQKR